MPDSPTPITREPTPIRELHWSPAEKAAARRAFHPALKKELDAVMREAKERAARIEEISELWELEHWLTERRHALKVLQVSYISNLGHSPLEITHSSQQKA